MNGTAGYAFEMDGIHKESIVHPNAQACPVAFAFLAMARLVRYGISRLPRRFVSWAGSLVWYVAEGHGQLSAMPDCRAV